MHTRFFSNGSTVSNRSLDTIPTPLKPEEIPLLEVSSPGARLRRAPRLVEEDIAEIPATRDRVLRHQGLWRRINDKLPSQISRRHISVISVGGVIGTGVFIGVSNSLRHAGPIGALIAYLITGSIVWSVVISIGEMVAWLPNVGGPVGLACLYVDPALGFALGWNAWYNWAVILPAELSAAALALESFPSINPTRRSYIAVSVLLGVSTLVNCLGAGVFGEVEFFLSLFKVLLICGLIVMSLFLDVRKGNAGVIGLSRWNDPGPFVKYRDIPPRAWGDFLGLWTVIMQACFSFFGTEVAAIAAGEVINPRANIPRAVNRVWIRIFLFYVGAVFAAGLLVRSDDCRLGPPQPEKNCTMKGVSQPYNISIPSSSPFIIAVEDAGLGPTLKNSLTIAFAISAWSAGTSDIYMSSRFLFFLAECGQAPGFLRKTPQWGKSFGMKIIVPYFSVLMSFLIGLLAFLSVPDSRNSAMTTKANDVFKWLSSMTAAASLLSWVGMMFTYLRFFYGRKLQESKTPEFRKVNLALYGKKWYHKWQPIPAWYAFLSCVGIVFCNGWYVFTQKSFQWRIAEEPTDGPPISDPDIGPFVPTFISSYLPIPFFLLCMFGYKLVYRSEMVKLEDMPWHNGHVEPITDTEEPKGLWKIVDSLF
ncbi:hypothetical protein SISSUDRAFT_1131836 [Sistotremastrum suecicum HHB10207 ss-3]|uniref:Amino acid permease/ SLC12A domain-containing protein n=1 Tax=Sistotremastrum suecicum HHB10207 ss-3 TaxID=1314776 RepID=A0A165ZN10_9AGAM|nr:hypothetical protein SISSUDRAFT_1131836 [Sistotremastrum suecicum HHB10207 ss-3]